MEIKQISASRIKTFDHCQFKYVLNYMLFECHDCEKTFYTPEMYEKACPYCKSINYSKPELSTNWGAVHGSALHEVMENYAIGIRGTHENCDKVTKLEKKKLLDWKQGVADAYKRNDKGFAIWDIAKVKDTENTKKWCKGCQSDPKGLCEITSEVMTKNCPRALYLESLELIEKYIDRFGPIFNNRKVLGIEKAFTIDFGEKDASGAPIISGGFMDLVTELDSDTIEVFDYKFGSWVPSFEEFSEDIQVKLYSLAARSVFPQYKEVIITFDYARKNPMSTGFTVEDDAVTRQEVIDYWKRIQGPQVIRRTIIDGNGIDPTSSWKCKVMCDVKVCCREWPRFKEKFNA